MINKIALLKLEYPKIIIEASLVVFLALIFGASDLLIAFLISTLLYLYARSSEMSHLTLGVFSTALMVGMLLYLSMTSGLEITLLLDFEKILNSKKVLTAYVSFFLIIQSIFGYLVVECQYIDNGF